MPKGSFDERVEAERNRLDAIREDLIAWARHTDWTWWVTLTFRRQRRDYIAAQVTIERELAALPTVLQPLRVLCALEAHASGFLHAHALWQAPAGSAELATYRQMNEWWWERQGIGRFYPYDKARGAAAYITKYLLKDEHVDSHWFVWTPERKE